MNIKNILIKIEHKLFPHKLIDYKCKKYIKRFKKFSFNGIKCKDYKQYEAVITRLYHTIEKGLAYADYRAGFGKDNIEKLLSAMENYLSMGYDSSAFFFSTALSTLYCYIEKNKKHGVETVEIEKRIHSLKGVPNALGGTIEFAPLKRTEVNSTGYKDFFLSRHSMRHFSDEPVEMERIIRALELSQHTPSACNRQGWRSIIIEKSELKKEILANQNGNRGFGHEIDKIIVILADLRCFNYDREVFQAFIDAGMYSQSVLNALHYEGLATVPLSAALTKNQESNIRKLLNINEAMELIMLVGVGNYPECCLSTRSERRKAEIEIL